MKLNIQKLEKIRGEKGLSKAKFARYLSIEQSVYAKLANSTGESVTVKTLNRIGNALHIDPRELLTR